MTAIMEWDMPAPGEWTTDDLDALPDDGRRRELIDGVLFMSPSPTTFHQNMAGRLMVALEAMCPSEYAVTQAVEVRISKRRSLSPDVLVTTAEAAGRNPSHYSAHEVALAIEIVSPGSLTMDRITKPALYAQAGIPFYWRIEVDRGLLVATYRLDVGSDVYAASGEFTDVIRLDEPFPISLPIARFARPLVV